MSTTLERPDLADPSAPNTPELATETLYLIPIAQIDPNPDNPRRRFVLEQLEELAADLRARGVLQSLVVRRRGDRYELIAGERRYRAAQLAGLETVPCRIREYADEKAALLDMLAENLSRADLNPWEEARAYAKLVEAGMTQGEVAAQFGKSQPTVANTLKLLELPEAVQQLVAEGRLSKSKAQQVGRWVEAAPEYCLWLAGQVAERGLSEATLREGLPLWNEASQAGKIQMLYSHELPFSVNEVCKGCPHLIQVKQLNNRVCGNVTLFREHEAEGQRKQQEEARRRKQEAEAERERLRARLEAQRQKVGPSEAVPAGETHSSPNTEGPTSAETRPEDVAPTAPPAPEAAPAKQSKLVYLEELRYRHPAPVIEIDLQKLPEGCQGKLCPCAVPMPKSQRDPKIVWCCNRPGHHHALAAKHVRVNKKSLRQEFADRIEAALHQLRETGHPNSAMLAPIAYRRLKNSRKDALRKAFDAFGLAWPPEVFSLTFNSEAAARPQVIAALRGLPVMTLIGLCLVAGFTMDVAEAVEYQRDFCPELDEFLELPPSEAALAKRAEVTRQVFAVGDGAELNAWLRAIGQPGIPNPNAPAVSEEQSDEDAEPAPAYAEWRENVTDTPLPADQCPQCGHQLAPDGSCPGCVPPAQEAPDYEVQCFRCGDPLPVYPCTGEECEHLANGVTVDPRGCIATPQGAYYCRSCRPDVRICRECGCTDETGCEEGCSWVELDLCSACTGQLHLPETEPAKPGKAQAAALRIAELEAEIAKLERAAVDAAAERCRAEKVRGSQAARPRRERIAAEERGKRAGQIETLRRKIERIRAGVVEPAAVEATAAEAAADPQLDEMSCSRTDCGRPLTRAQHEVSLRQFGTPLCPPCQKQAVAAEPAIGDPKPDHRGPRRLAASEPPPADWIAAWNAWAAGKPHSRHLPCAGCGKALDLAEGAYTAVIDGQERPVCEDCRGAEKGEPADESDVIASLVTADSPLAMTIPWNLREVEAGDTVCGQLMPGGSIYRCPVLRVESEALVIRVLFGERAIPWTEPALATWEIVKRAGQEATSAEPSCTECGLVLGSANAGQGQRIGDALLCGQCLSTNTIREKHGLQLIPGNGWGAAAPPDLPIRKASPKYEPGAHVTWVAEHEGKPCDWKGIVVGLAPHTVAAYQVDAYEPVVRRVQVPRNGRVISRLPDPAPSTPPPAAPAMTYGPSANCDFQPASLDEPAAPPVAGFPLGARLYWVDPVSFRGRRGDLTGIDEVGIATIEATDPYNPSVVYLPAHELRAKGFRLDHTPPELESVPIAAAGPGDVAAWPDGGVLYRGRVHQAGVALVVDVHDPIVKRMEIPRDTEGLVILSGGAK